MKIKLFVLCFFIVQNSWAKYFKVIAEVLRPPMIFSDGPQIVATENLNVSSNFKLKTADNQSAKLIIGGSYELSVFNNSEVHIGLRDASEPELGFFIRLISGQIYIKTIASAAQSFKVTENTKLDLSSDFFEWSLSALQPLNLLINLDMANAALHFCNRELPFEISLFDHEKKINLSAGESVVFQGHMTGERGHRKVVFDLLLNQRKIPQGKWLEKKTCSFDEFLKQEKAISEKAQKDKIQQNLVIQKAKILKKKQDATYLCHHPYGQLGDCTWSKQGIKCLRRRCDATGKWADPHLFSLDKSANCETKIFASKCDY